MDIMPSFDASKFSLGRLCKHNHNFQETGKSLRRKSDRHCIECEGTKNPGTYNDRSKAPPEERFWRQVKKSDEANGCWIWQGAKYGHGYGKFRLGRERKAAHRYSYQLHYGEIPNRQHILHHCDTPACVNPQHLYAGTHQDNMRDRTQKKRENPVRGSKHCHAKLTHIGCANNSELVQSWKHQLCAISIFIWCFRFNNR